MLVKRIYVGPERREVEPERQKEPIEPERQEEHIEPAKLEEQKEKIYRPSGGFNPNQEPLIRGSDAVTESTKLRISLEERVKLRRSFWIHQTNRTLRHEKYQLLQEYQSLR